MESGAHQEAEAREAWRRTCDAVNGAGLGTTVAALRASGALGTLAAAEAPVRVQDWALRHGLHGAYAELAALLLATQGWAERTSPGEGGATTLRLTPAGRSWLPHAGVYDTTIARLDAATSLRSRLAGAGPPRAPRWDGLHDCEAPGASPALREQLRRHVRGPLLASAMGGLYRSGVFEKLCTGSLGWVPVGQLGVPEPLLGPCLGLLADEGFLVPDDDMVCLTPRGHVAARWAALHDYVVSYAGVYRDVPALLGVSSAVAGPPPASAGALDRQLLLHGKAHVLVKGVHTMLVEALRPVFQAPPGARPRFVLDPHAGDASTLVMLARALGDLARDARGEPIPLVGVVGNALSRARSEASLAGAGLRHLLVDGEIADPDGIAAALAERGLDLRDAIVVNKGSIHGRRHRGAQGEALRPRSGPTSCAVFVSPAHETIPSADMEDDLAAFFRRWARHVPRHGLVVADTHTVAPHVAAASVRENALGHVLSSHGWSHQYLIEVERFRHAAARAGLETRFSRDLGSPLVARPTMSAEHFALPR